MQGAQVRFQVGELRSCMPHGVAKMNRDLIEKKKKIFFTETEVSIIVTKGWEKGWRGSISGRQFQFGDNEQVLEMGGGDVCTATRVYLIPWNSMLSNG